MSKFYRSTALETIDFTKPQRLHPAGNIMILFKYLWRILKASLVLIIYLLVRYATYFNFYYLGLLVLFLLLILLAVSYMHYRSYLYYVDLEGSELIIQEGLFEKSKTVVKFSNILQVNINQNLLQQLLSIYSLTLDTAGSEQVEVSLYALDKQQAQALKSFMVAHIHPTTARAATTDNLFELSSEDLSAQSPILHLPAKNILLVSFLSNYRQGLVLFFAFCFTLYQYFKDFIEALQWEDTYDIDISKWRAWIAFLIAGLFFIILIPFVINLFRYFIKYYNFTIAKNTEGTISLHYGLLEVKDAIFNRSRVQITRFKQNRILKALGIGIIALRQVVQNEKQSEQSMLEIPGIANKDKETIYDLVFEEDVFEAHEVLTVQPGLFISRVIKSIVIYGLLSIGLLWSNPVGYLTIGYTVLLVFFVLTTVYNYGYYRNYQIFWNGKYLIKREGVWNEKETVVPINRTQMLEVSQTFWQIKANTANLHVSTASDVISFRFIERDRVVQLSNRILYTVEIMS